MEAERHDALPRLQGPAGLDLRKTGHLRPIRRENQRNVWRDFRHPQGPAITHLTGTVRFSLMKLVRSRHCLGHARQILEGQRVG